MLKQYVFDIETDGLLDEVTTIHLLIMKDIITQEIKIFSSLSDNIEEGVEELFSADLLIGHNIINFDLPVLKKLYNGRTTSKIPNFDTLVVSRLIYPTISLFDIKNKVEFPDDSKYKHSLQAWGHRLKFNKMEYTDGWKYYSKKMEEYCIQDVLLTEKLYRFFLSKNYSIIIVCYI